MKAKIHTLIIMLASLAGVHQAVAQGTEFTYQGQLQNNGIPANGSYDLTFGLFNTNSGGNEITATFTNMNTSVNKGLFTVSVDFGTAFGSANYWLEIAVRTNGGGAFATLSPRQIITPVPQAIHAGTAGTASLADSVSASNISGPILDGNLPTNVALLNANVTFTGNVSAANFSGNGAGLTNLPASGGGFAWQIVSGMAQQAQSNEGYLVTNDALTIITLPAVPNVGDVVRVSGIGSGGWQIVQNSGQCIQGKNFESQIGNGWHAIPPGLDLIPAIALSADGTQIVESVASSEAGDSGTYSSTNFFVTYRYLNTNVFYSIASSSDGTKLVGSPNNGKIWTSTNSGTTWSAVTLYGNSSANVASSADGVVMVAAFLYSGVMWTSTNSGATWRGATNSVDWGAIALSANGSNLVAQAGSSFWTSTNAGVSWSVSTNDLPVGGWSAIASSADGTHLAVAVDYGNIWTSTDSGATWTPRASSQDWSSIASSADGTKLAAGSFGYGYATGPATGLIWISTDSGVTWTANSPNQQWNAIVSSADGTKLAAIGNDAVGAIGGEDYVYAFVGAYGTTSGTAGYLQGGPNTAIELLYVGNGQFITLSQEGSILAH